MRTIIAVMMCLLASACGGSGERDARRPMPTSLAGSSGTWRLTWSDEFNGSNGSGPDPAKWAIETGGSRWGNPGLEDYASRTQNAHHGGGKLLLTAPQVTENRPD